MKYHYVYRITNTTLTKHYYGVRTSKNKLPSEDIGIYYFSSSKDKDFINDQKLNSQNYKYKVIRITDTREEAALLEILLHKKFNVKVNENFYNKTNACALGFDATGLDRSGPKNSMFGKTHTQNTKELMSFNHKGMSGKKFSKETINHMKNISKTSSNNNAKTIFIFSSDNKLQYTCSGNFKSICDENNLPYSQLMKSYKNNNEPIFENLNASSKTRMMKMNRFQFRGWYATL